MAEFGDLGESLQYVEYMSQLPDTNSARRLISKSLKRRQTYGTGEVCK